MEVVYKLKNGRTSIFFENDETNINVASINKGANGDPMATPSI